MKTQKPSPKALKKSLEILTETYPDWRTELTYESPFQLIIAVILSAQCTSAQVNKTTPALFKKYPTAETMAKAPLRDLEKLVHSCGFYHMKAKAILKTSQSILEKFDGEVPGTLEELVTLAGVGRKTASVVLNQAFDVPAIAVDTHVARVSQRLGWAKSKDPVKIEFELRELLPEEWWTRANGTMILHGRRICSAKKPKCPECPLAKYCASYPIV